MSRLRPYKVQPCGKLHPLDKRSSVITVYLQNCVASYPAYLFDRSIQPHTSMTDMQDSFGLMRTNLSSIPILEGHHLIHGVEACSSGFLLCDQDLRTEAYPYGGLS